MPNKIPKSWKQVSQEDLDAEESSSMFGSSMGSPASGFIEEHTSGTLKDMATVIPQAMTLEFADELLEQASPELAQDYREAVKIARKNSPIATTVTELFTPDAIDLITGGAGKALKLGKIVGILKNAGMGAAGSAVTDVAHQLGSTGEVDLSRTAMSAGMGAGLRGAGGAISDIKKGRKNYVGADPADFVNQGKGALGAEDYLDEVITDFDSKGLFKSGAVEFDPKSGSWFNLEGKTTLGQKAKNLGSKVKGTVIPPSQKEVLSRIENAKKHIASEISRLVESGSAKEGQLSFMADGMGIASGEKGRFGKEEFLEGIEDFLNALPFDSETQENLIRGKIGFQLKKLFGESGDLEATLIEIHDMRKRLDQAVKYDRKGNATEPMKEQAFKGLASILRKTVAETLEGTPMAALNKQYGDLATMTAGLEKKVLGRGKGKFKSGLLAGNIGYKAASAVEALGDTASGITSQLSKSVQESPARNLLSRGVRKLVPSLDSGQEASPIIAREPQSFNPMSPAERMEVNLPKKIQQSKLPRNSEGVKENSKLFKLKVAQDSENMVLRRMQKAGVDTSQVGQDEVEMTAKELYSNISMVLDETPEKVPAMLPVWIQQFPELFESDRYGRIEGVVPNSRRPEVREEIRKNPEISNIERINQLDLLNRSGEYSID